MNNEDLGPLPEPVIEDKEPNPGGVDAVDDPEDVNLARDLDPEDNPAVDDVLPDEIAEAGVIRMGLDGAYPPFGSISEEDGETLVGLDADLAREMAALMGALGCRRAMLLDGGISGQLRVRAGPGPELRLPAWRRVPMGLVGRLRD